MIVSVYEEVNVPQKLCRNTAISHLISIGWKIKATLFEILMLIMIFNIKLNIQNTISEQH